MRRHVIGMTNTLAHRGPDDEGAWVDPIAEVALGNRRLAIIDLSPEGHMPMHSASGRYVITYNGEIYNSAEIARTAHAGLAPRWRGHSDTEVMLAAIEAWGLNRALKSFNGMFAFALWDARERTLCLVRDQLGVKPLYYGRLNGALVFASELKAIAVYPDAALTIDREWLNRYLRQIHLRSEETIYRGVRGIPPGTHVTFDQKLQAHEHVYWSATDKAEIGHHDRFPGSEAEAVESLDSLLSDAVRLREVSDVPLGVLLSGGINSFDGTRASAAGEPEDDPKLLDRLPQFGPRRGARRAEDRRSHRLGSHRALHGDERHRPVDPFARRLSDQPQSDPSYAVQSRRLPAFRTERDRRVGRRRRRRAIRGLSPPSMAAKGVPTARLAAGRNPEARSASADGDPTGDVGQDLRHHRAGGPFPATRANPWRQASSTRTLDGLCLR